MNINRKGIQGALRIALAAVLLAVSFSQAQAADQGNIRIGAKSFTEQRLLATMTQLYLQHLGYNVDVTWGLSTSISRPAQLNNELDMVWEYTGTSLLTYNHIDEVLDSEQSYKRVSELDGKQGLVWLDPTEFNNTYAIAMPEEIAKENGDLRTLSEFAKWTREHPDQYMLFAMDYDFAGRADGLLGLDKKYHFGFSRGEKRSMDPGLVYLALRNQQAFGGVVYTTDGRINAFNLRVLDDDLNFFPAYNAAPVVRADYLEQHPQLRAQMKRISDLLDDQTIRSLNTRVDVDQQSANTVARDFLSKHGLI